MLALGEVLEHGHRGPGRRGVAVDQGADHVHAAVAGPVGQGAAQGGRLHLLRRPLVVRARLRAVDDATAGELRRAGRALAGAAGALLLVGLAATAADLAAGLGGVGALAGGGQLGDDDLVDQRDVDLDVEDLGRQLDRAGLLAGRRQDVDRVDDCGVARRSGFGRHDGHFPFAAVRTRTRPPLGPGTAPLMSSRPFSASTAWTVRFWRGLAHVAHPAGHPHALEHPAGGGAAADRAGLAVVAVGTVGGADAVEAVPLHDTGEALALGGARRRRRAGRPRTPRR